MGTDRICPLRQEGSSVVLLLVICIATLHVVKSTCSFFALKTADVIWSAHCSSLTHINYVHLNFFLAFEFLGFPLLILTNNNNIQKAILALFG